MSDMGEIQGMEHFENGLMMGVLVRREMMNILIYRFSP